MLIYNQMVFVGTGRGEVRRPGSTGVVYGFDLSTGNLLHVYGDQFNVPHGMGWTMSIVNGDLLVGDPTSQTGHAFEFDINTGAVLHGMHQPAGTGGATFGADVAAVGGLEAVGMSPSGQAAQGAAYLYSSGTWSKRSIHRPTVSTTTSRRPLKLGDQTSWSATFKRMPVDEGRPICTPSPNPPPSHC